VSLDDRDLSPQEQGLAAELAHLIGEPSPQRRARIMAAVRTAPAPRTEPILRPWRLVLAGVAAIGLLLASAVGAVAASADALPSSPNYSLRQLGEQVRLTFAEPKSREELRISFAESRISQAQSALRHGDRSNARGLLADSRTYLQQARQNLSNLPSDEQGEVENDLSRADASENQTQTELDQEGDQNAHGG
jgi:hypothetical protein